MKDSKWILRRVSAALALALLLAAVFLSANGAFAQRSSKIVRVGWYDSPFNRTDDLDRRSGYAYEYQQKIAAYTGWTYEYVTGSWPDLLQMLIDGRIDLLSDVSYTPERAEMMLYSSLPMGAEEYYIFISPKNRKIVMEDYATFNGKRAGVNKGSVQAEILREWAEANGVQLEIVELTGLEDDNLDLLGRGKIDMYVTLDGVGDVERNVPICKIGASDFFFTVSSARPELLPELNAAISRIQDEDPYFNEHLYAKYLKTTGLNNFVSAGEGAWLEAHGIIRVGYQDNYLAFCSKDERTGALTGALKDYLAVASDCLENIHIDFEATAYPSAASALSAMKRGEVDCVFPANLTDYDGEVKGYFITAPLMRTDMSAVIRETDLKTFGKSEHITVAVNAGNPNYDMFLLDHFPNWRSIYFKDTSECLKAISDDKADCLLISHYRYNNIARLCEKYHLTTVSTGVEMDYCFAVNRSDTILYSILNKIAAVVPTSTINAALSYYFTEDAKTNLVDLLKQNMALVLAGILAVALVILFLLLRGDRAKRSASASRQLISATETDNLTGLYCKNYFYQYAGNMYRVSPDRPMDAVVLNIRQFHIVNEINGHDFGDQVLRELGEEIQGFIKENKGIASRGEADHFAIYCAHMDDSRALYDRLQGRLDALSSNTSICLLMGVMPWHEGMPPERQIEEAVAACRLANSYYTDNLVVYDDDVRERVGYEQRLLSDLSHALDHREFEVHYQPKYDIQSDPPKLKSAEALVRWRHPEFGLIAPGEFIPLFERHGKVGAVDRFVWSEAAKQVAAWKAAHGRTIPVSVNLSRLDLFDPSLEDTLDALINANGLNRSDLKLEIAESTCAENAAQVISIVEALRRKGYEIEMDDFGSGASSLNMLSALPIDALKMDRAFVSDIDENGKDVQFAALILDIARYLKIPVIAEGVETAEQLRVLREMDCTLAQGFFFSQPLTAEAFEAEVIRKR